MNTQINVDENLLNQVIMLGHYTSQEEAVAQACVTRIHLGRVIKHKNMVL
jgi:Bacterial antitoxin of type II TA system, VapB